MDFARAFGIVTICAVMTACGGGGGSGGGSAGTPSSPATTGTPQPPAPPSGSPPAAPPPEPKINVAVTQPSLSLELSVGDEYPLEIQGSWAGTDLNSADPIYLRVVDPDARFKVPDAQLGASGGAFTFKLQTLPSISAGAHTGTMTIKACKDAACSTAYAGTPATVSYSLVMADVADWETHQRDAAHTAYVPIWLDAARFARAWEWDRGPSDEPIGGINAVVTHKGKVYVTTDVYFGEGSLTALNETDGTQAWRASFGEVPALGPPAVKGDIVFAATTGHEDTFLWAFDSNTGTYLRKSAFEGQWPHTLAPTVYGDRVYTGAGYYGGTTYSFSTADGARTWAYATGGAWDLFTPAVDDKYVYNHDGSAMYLIDKVTGTGQQIADPFGGSSGYSYHGSPMLGTRGNVIAFAKGAFSGRASSNVEQYDQRVLSSFNIAAKIYEWSTSYAYLTAPAVKGGSFFAARNSPMSLDAIDEATGQVLWSWTPTNPEDSEFHRNIVVTKNLLFVSTNSGVHAIDLATRKSVWRYPQPGMLAISADRTLYIATGATQSDGKLVAIRLQPRS